MEMFIGATATAAAKSLQSCPTLCNPREGSLSPNASGGLTPFNPPSELQEIQVATREQSEILCFHSR